MTHNLAKKTNAFSLRNFTGLFNGKKNLDGLLIVNKKRGPTSFDVVQKLRNILNYKRIGHTGTLDPFASGVLVCCLGKGTKIVQFITFWGKEYIAKIKLGEQTDTYDSQGKIVKKFEECFANEGFVLEENKIKSVIDSFKGEIWQTPPLYSAIKYKGKKLYQFAREGKKIKIKKRKVKIENVEILKIKLPFVWIKVRCSKGTYIRSLGFDIGEKLGCGAYLISLCRTKVGPFELKDSFTLDAIRKIKDEGKLNKIVVSMEKALENLPSLVVSDENKFKIKHGQDLKVKDIKSVKKDFSKKDRVVLKDDSGKILAIGESLVSSEEISDEQKVIFRYMRVVV